jgi:NOL1/NOP2/fmu family ribosome biogenesis protein
MKPLTSPTKKRILSQLNKQFGIEKLPYLILQFGKEKLRLFSGHFSIEEINLLDANLRIETAGLYFAKIENNEIRLTLDGIQILKNQITKNILELTNEQADKWMRGNDLDIKSEKAYKILKNKNEFLGCGKSTGEKITNFVPKERRIK